jgi:hypothetical protein
MAIENPREPGAAGDLADSNSSARMRHLIHGAMSAAMLSHKLAMIDIEAKHRLAWYHSHYNPNQPRVPAGHPDGGQWTKEGGGVVRLAANEKFPIGPNIFSIILGEAANEAIKRYRDTHNLWDLFGGRVGTVSRTDLNGKEIWGSNSRSPSYTRVDRVAAERIRDAILAKCPQLMKSDNVGQMPINAVFHSETTILLRAARENGGSLAGQTLEVVSDRELCNNCEVTLPKVALELGNPKVRFIDPSGRRLIMQDGRWLP